MYCEVAELRVYLGMAESVESEEGDESLDALLENCLNAAQAAIDSYCRQSFEATTDSTRYFDPARDVVGRDLFLDSPLAAITSITNGDGGAVAVGQYTTEPRNGTPYHRLALKAEAGIAWNSNGGAIAIAGKWAYSVQAPADIKQACTRWAAWFYRQRDNAGDLDRTMIVGNTTILPGEIPGDVLMLLRPYRRLLT